jgi:hypothetical protein
MALILETATAFDVHIAKVLHRYAYIQYRNMEHFADAVAHYVEASEIPRDPFMIFPTLGIGLEREQLSQGSRAVWVRINDVYAIHYSQYEARTSVCFSLWHEFFEILAQQRAFPSAYTPERREKMADRFAAAILMPETVLKEDVIRFHTNAEALPAVLADRFGVSLAAMKRRLREIGGDTKGGIHALRNQ